MSCSSFQLLCEHTQILQQNVLKVINPNKCSPTEAIQLEIISLISSIVDYLNNQKQTIEEIIKKVCECSQPLNETINVDPCQELCLIIEKPKDRISEFELPGPLPLPKEFNKLNDDFGEITPYYSHLKEWCRKSEAHIIFEGKDLTSKTFWQLTKNLNNMMVVIQTEDNYMFGSYHSVLPKSQDVWIQDDPNHFVFTLINPNHVKPCRFDPLPTNNNLLFIYGDNDTDNVVWVNYCYWITCDNVIYLWHHFPEYYIDTTGFGGDLFVGCVDWDNPNEIKKVYVLEWVEKK
ncbi:hypothetical protein ENUP19_0229G0010 [Entamoeba nuttalli]|uniref:TLDc domain-containing protein n=2 Tax=Entamoeba nuttalli TaxID=412467 RepID=K2H056_ENTNP|nr:hypothetical protein ENU1_122390 [Entamoeba nuttalli P19]EKE39597.1 hypothetical protein ENU1_122390 [Entamoeba nuttalli P19]|eukprot:XP_008858074.1 hypothetical protein ENU1_122390 [Entamoeba nuttalli P19]